MKKASSKLIKSKRSKGDKASSDALADGGTASQDETQREAEMKIEDEAKEQEEQNQEQMSIKRYKLPNLCDPDKGQLFHNWDKFEDWDEFEDVYKD